MQAAAGLPFLTRVERAWNASAAAKPRPPPSLSPVTYEQGCQIGLDFPPNLAARCQIGGGENLDRSGNPACERICRAERKGSLIAVKREERNASDGLAETGAPLRALLWKNHQEHQERNALPRQAHRHGDQSTGSLPTPQGIVPVTWIKMGGDN